MKKIISFIGMLAFVGAANAGFDSVVYNGLEIGNDDLATDVGLAAGRGHSGYDALVYNGLEAGNDDLSTEVPPALGGPGGRYDAIVYHGLEAGSADLTTGYGLCPGANATAAAGRSDDPRRC